MNSGSTITYKNIVTGSQKLTDNGSTIFGGLVTVDSLKDNGPTDINGGGVTTSGGQIYNGVVT